MNAVLSQRKYRLAARLANDTARTFGLWWTAAFVFLAVASVVFRAFINEYMEFAYYALFAIPLVMLASGWVHLRKSYPLAIANGLTRKEFLAAFAVFGAATVLAAAAFTQLGRLALDLLEPSDGRFLGFYGLGPFDSVARPAVWFTVGAAAGAVMLRSRGRWLGTVVSALMVAAVFYRQVGSFFAINIGDLPREDGTLFEIPVDMTTNSLAWIDIALAVLFALIAWGLLARAPMRPKPA